MVHFVSLRLQFFTFSPGDKVSTPRINIPTIEVSPGELIDKITILEIKAERINDAKKRANVLVELATLNQARRRDCIR